jgi:hypothetical protein
MFPAFVKHYSPFIPVSNFPIYRLIQEGLSNIRKHADDDHAAIRCRDHPGKLERQESRTESPANKWGNLPAGRFSRTK